MSWTQADITALKTAIGSGAQSVTYSDGSSVSYRNLNDMRTLLKMIEAEVSPPAAPIRAFRVSPRSGY